MNGRSELGWIAAPVIGLAFVDAICVLFAAGITFLALALATLIVQFAGHSAAVCDAFDLCKLYGQLGDPVLVHSQA